MKYEIRYIKTETKMIDGKLATVKKELDLPKPNVIYENVIYQYDAIPSEKIASSSIGAELLPHAGWKHLHELR